MSPLTKGPNYIPFGLLFDTATTIDSHIWYSVFLLWVYYVASSWKINTFFLSHRWTPCSTRQPGSGTVAIFIN